MFLRTEELDSSRGSSDRDASRTNEETMLRKAKSDKNLFNRKQNTLEVEVRFRANKEYLPSERKPHEVPPRRNLRAETEVNAIEVIQSMLIEDVRSANNKSDKKIDIAQCRQTESVASMSCIESLRDSLIFETKKRKDLEFSLQLKSRMITELKLQNDLYEKLSTQQPRLSNLSQVAEKEMVILGSERKKLPRKPNIHLEKRASEVLHSKTVKHLGKVKKELRETEVRRHQVAPKLQQPTETSLQNVRYKKMVKTFGDVLSKLARKQVTRDGKQSKDLRELSDVWNRLLRDIV